MLLNLPWRFRHGHPAALAVMTVFITGVCLGAVALFPHLPRPLAVAVGIVWFVVAVRESLASPPGQ